MRIVLVVGVALALLAGCTGPLTTSPDQPEAVTRIPESKDSGEGQRGTREATASEFRRAVEATEFLHDYESTLQLSGRTQPKPRGLQPEIVRLRVSRADPDYGIAVVELRDRAGALTPETTVLLLQRAEGTHGPNHKWWGMEQTATSFSGGCLPATPQAVRDLACPDPWSVLHYPRPDVRLDRTVAAPEAVADIHLVDWSEATLPGKACRSEHPIALRDGQAWTRSADRPWWSGISVYAESGRAVVYGDLDGDGRDEAAVEVWCSNGGGTAAGQLFSSAVIVRTEGGALSLVDVITPRQPISPTTTHVPLLDLKRDGIERGHLISHEAWYGYCDGTAGPSGKAVTDWRYVAGRLIPSTTVQFLPVMRPCGANSRARRTELMARAAVPDWLEGIVPGLEVLGIRVPGVSSSP